MNKREIGSEYELKAEKFLNDAGMKTLQKNYRTRSGEIDLIMDDQGTLVFVEVKYRRSSSFGYAAEAIGIRKQLQIRSVAREYLAHTEGHYRSMRFDCVGFTGEEMRYIKNAF